MEAPYKYLPEMGSYGHLYLRRLVRPGPHTSFPRQLLNLFICAGPRLPC